MAKKEKKHNIAVRIICGVLAFLMFGTTFIYVIVSIINAIKG